MWPGLPLVPAAGCCEDCSAGPPSRREVSDWRSDTG